MYIIALSDFFKKNIIKWIYVDELNFLLNNIFVRFRVKNRT